jgi:hypothetical protein
MRSEELDVHGLKAVVNPGDQPVVVALDIEDDAIVLNDARIRVPVLNILRARPLSRKRVVVPRLQKPRCRRVVRTGVQVGLFGYDVHADYDSPTVGLGQPDSLEESMILAAYLHPRGEVRYGFLRYRPRYGSGITALPSKALSPLHHRRMLCDVVGRCGLNAHPEYLLALAVQGVSLTRRCAD